MPADRHPRLVVGPRSHRINSELAGGRLGDVQSCLALRDVAGGHQKMHVLARRDGELVHQVHFRPADDLAVVPVDYSSQELATPVIQEPNAIGLRLGRDRHGAGAHDVVLKAVVGRMNGRRRVKDIGRPDGYKPGAQ